MMRATISDRHLGRNKPRGRLWLRTYALCPHGTTRFFFGDHSLQQRGVADDPLFVTAEYGTRSGALLSQAFQQAASPESGVFPLRLHYQAPGVLTSQRADSRLARATGIVFTDRLMAAYRDELREDVLEVLRPLLPNGKYVAATKLDLESVLVRHPWVVRNLMHARLWLDLMVYPTLLQHQQQGDKPIYVATLRTSRAAEMRAQVVYLEDECSAFGGRSAQMT